MTAPVGPATPAGDPAAEHEALQRGLAPVFSGPFEAYRAKVAVGGAGLTGLVSGRDIVAPERLERAGRALAVRHGTEDRRALLGLWCKLYVDTVVPVTMVASLVLGRTLPVALDDIAFAVDDDGAPRCMVLSHGGTASAPGDPYERFATLIGANLEPVIAALSAQRVLSPRALWGNAASHADWVLVVLRRNGAITDADAASCARLFDSRTWPDGRAFPFGDGLRPDGRAAHGLRWRRVCCARYLLPALRDAYCSNCPKIRPREPHPP